jgi:hypothetical protein
LDADISAANLAMARVTAARAQAQKEGQDAKSMFFGLAEAKSKEGQRSLGQNSYIDARCAFMISEKLFRMRQDYLKFLLIHHPLDCPICDAGGECQLQDLVHEYGLGPSRFSEKKRSVAPSYHSKVVDRWIVVTDPADPKTAAVARSAGAAYRAAPRWRGIQYFEKDDSRQKIILFNTALVDLEKISNPKVTKVSIGSGENVVKMVERPSSFDMKRPLSINPALRKRFATHIIPSTAFQ